jgi:hypothetical protein
MCEHINMWFITTAVAFWLETRIFPFAYGHEYEDPKCPAAKIPIRMLEILVTVPAILIDVLLTPIYLITSCIKYCLGNK